MRLRAAAEKLQERFVIRRDECEVKARHAVEQPASFYLFESALKLRGPFLIKENFAGHRISYLSQLRHINRPDVLLYPALQKFYVPIRQPLEAYVADDRMRVSDGLAFVEL